jgi:pilus assembly protein Flp/PilA
MNALTYLMNRFKIDRRGVTALEYGLIASLVAVVLITGATSLGTKLNSTFSALASSI